jgi:SAM-dependent methyltransferase
MKKPARFTVPDGGIATKRPDLPGNEGEPRRVTQAAYDPTVHLRQWMDEGLQGLPRGSAILGLGCEQAFLASQLTEYASDVTVLDTSAAQIAQLARRFPEVAFQQHSLSQALPFAHDTFDAIWCCDFLDRVFDPVAALREMHRVLAPNGRLLVTVPNHGPVRQLLQTLFRGEDPGATALPRIRHFTKSTLAILASEAGWTKIHVAAGGRAVVARNLFMTASKGPGVQILPVARREDFLPEGGLWGELALAGRQMAA